MTKKSNFCDTCAHYNAKLRNVCEAGHRPRFYCPDTWAQAFHGDWGWKRRCEDFVAKSTAEPMCMCAARPAAQCPGPWEPGCDLGANEAYVVRV
jgi:hypothetical protein